MALVLMEWCEEVSMWASVCITPVFMMEVVVVVGDVLDWSMGLTLDGGAERERKRERMQDEGRVG